MKEPTTRQLVMYAGASGDFYEIHYDKDFAAEQGLPGVILHGALKSAYLGQLVTGWVGAEGRLLSLSVRYREMDVPGDVLTCRGTVVERGRGGGLRALRHLDRERRGRPHDPPAKRSSRCRRASPLRPAALPTPRGSIPSG